MPGDFFQQTIERYRRTFREHGETPAAVMWPKGRQPVRFSSLTRHFDKSVPLSVLDYGCGLADLKPFLAERFTKIEYTGADIMPEFVESDRRRYPDGNFLLIKSPSDIVGDYDYVVMSGVFNLRYDCAIEQHKDIVRTTLLHLFTHTRVAMSVDFMTDDVDYRGPDSYHQNVDEIYRYARSELGKRVIIDHSYLPYEYSLTIFKDEALDARTIGAAG